MCVHFEYRLNSGRAIPKKTCPILGAKLVVKLAKSPSRSMFHFQVFRRAEAKTFPVDTKGMKGRR